MPVTATNARVSGFRCPHRGEYYWDRDRHAVAYAAADMHTEHVILVEGVELPREDQSH